MNTTKKAKPLVANSSSTTKAPTSAVRSKTGGSTPQSDQKKQDRVTLIAFYALFGAIAAGVLYFFSLLLFI